jgi:chromosome segregation ATPase
MITVKEFAKKQHRSVQAIYQSIDRYKLQLEGHIKKVGRTSYLDDEAVAFLEAKREQNPVVVYQQDKDEELELLRKNADVMKAKIAELQEKVNKSQEDYIALQAENAKLLALPAETEKKLAVAEVELKNATEKIEEKDQKISEQKGEIEAQAAQLKTALDDAERQKQDFQKEIDRLTEELRIESSKTWWQKLWHK